MSTVLFEKLQAAYRIPSGDNVPDAKKPFSIDNKNERDYCLEFCRIRIECDTNQQCQLVMQFLPTNEEVLQIIADLPGQVTDAGDGHDVRIPLSALDFPAIRRLATAVRWVVARGQRYPQRNWKWMCKRTAKTLDRLANHLDQFQKSGRINRIRIPKPESAEDEHKTSGEPQLAVKKQTGKRRRVLDHVDDEENIFKICGVDCP